MKLSVLLLVIASARAWVVPNNDDCSTATIINNLKYETEVLKTDINSPYQLVIDYDTNTLFFSYSANTNEMFKSAYLNLKTNEFEIINGINGGFANTVDKGSSTVYLGGRDGIYKFNYDTKTAIDLHITNSNIWQLFYKKDLYYTEYPSEKAYKVVNGVVEIIQELRNTRAMLLAVDNNDNIYFSNSSGLFCYKRVSEHIINVGEFDVNGITIDTDGDVYFSTPRGLYHINGNDKQIATLFTANDNNIYGLAIENDGNIIYANENSVVRLKKTNQYCYKDMDLKPFADNSI